MRRWMAALAVLLFWHVGGALAEVPVPPLKARVTDLTGTLSADQVAVLERQLAAFEARRGSQIAILIVPTTQPEAIEQYSLRVAEAWKLGRKGVDDGVLLLVARDDRSLRIEVGYGLEGVIPDAIAKRIIAEIIVPKFKENDYFGGVQAGVNSLIRLIDGEPLPSPRQQGNGGNDPLGLLFMALVAAAFAGQVLTALFGRLLGAGIAATVIGGLAWLVVGSMLMALSAGILVFLVVLAGLNLGGGFGGGGLGGGSGGFGGGGGGFGGGGASGRW